MSLRLWRFLHKRDMVKIFTNEIKDYLDWSGAAQEECYDSFLLAFIFGKGKMIKQYWEGMNDEYVRSLNLPDEHKRDRTRLTF